MLKKPSLTILCCEGILDGAFNRKDMAGENPIIASVIPVYNERQHILDCLASLKNQDLDPNLHMVMVLDGGSQDGTKSLVEEFIKQNQGDGLRFILVDNPGQYVANARNLALELLPDSVEYLVELIGHSTVEPDHLRVRLEQWKKLEAECSNKGETLAALGVKVQAKKGELATRESWVEGALLSPLGSGSGQFSRFSGVSKTKVPPFAMHSRKAVAEAGGWDERFISSQDSDLSMRLIKAGYVLMRTDSTVVNMTKRTTLGNWWRMGYRYGFWRTKTVLTHRSRIVPQEFAPLFGLILTLALMYYDHSMKFYPAIAYAVVLGIEGLRSLIRSKRLSHIFGVPICLIMLHTSFSIGLIQGLYRSGKASTDRR